MSLKGKIKISAVSYLNTLPFHFGLENSDSLNQRIILSKDIPSVCADKLIKEEVDIGLIPVAAINKIPNARIISNYCIGAVGKVKSVLLFSHVPLKEIKRIYLDYQSRTSVNLIRILARDFWKIDPEFIQGTEGYEQKISASNAALIIGDRAFDYMNTFNYEYDLSEEWMKFQSLPFVFAVWVANKELPEEFIRQFNEALRSGLDSIDAVSEQFKNEHPDVTIDVNNYLKNDISFILDVEKRKALETFLRMLKSI